LPPEHDALDLEGVSPVESGALPVSIEGPSPANAVAPAVGHIEAPRMAADTPQWTSTAHGIQHTGLGMKQVVLLVVTMVFIAIAVSTAVTLYVARSGRPPAVETNQP
jgi:hypothetical protein